jgi:hypothetical protein
VATSYGTFTLGGGLGFGFFQPALDLIFQQGAEALSSLNGTLTLTCQILKPLSAGLICEVNPESHQGPLSIVLGGASDAIDEIDTMDLTGGAVVTVTPWEFLDFSLTAEQDTSTTYQWQNILHTARHTLNQTEKIPSATLASSLTFLDSFTLTVSFQDGVEDIPAGISYSSIRKRTQNLSSATTEGFTGYTLGLSYSL